MQWCRLVATEKWTCGRKINFTQKIAGWWLMAGPCMKYVLLFPGKNLKKDPQGFLEICI